MSLKFREIVILTQLNHKSAGEYFAAVSLCNPTSLLTWAIFLEFLHFFFTILRAGVQAACYIYYCE